MRYIASFLLITLIFSECKKSETIPTQTFSSDDRNWFIYEVGQPFTFKDSLGHSITYTVRTVFDSLRGEYLLHTSDSSWELVSRSETYGTTLYSDLDSIRIVFYKQFIDVLGDNKLHSGILWVNFKSQFPGLDALTNGTSFTTLSINNFTYSAVTGMTPTNDETDPWAFWKSGLYDQKFGIIEITDTSGTRWLRQN